MNNIPSVIARVLLDKGYNVTIFLIDEYGHFLPEADAREPIKGLKTITLNWSREELINLQSTEIKKAIGGYDFYIGVEWAPAITWKAAIKLDIFYVMGTDLSDYPFYKMEYQWLPKVWQLKYYLIAKQQYYGIKYTQTISMNAASNYLESKLTELQPKGNRIIGIPYLYLPQYNLSYIEKSTYKTVFDKIRNDNDFVIFHHVRHEWLSNKCSIHDKGNDKLLQALQQLIEANKQTKIALITLEYGTDTEASKALCKNLNIENNVHWLPKMNKKDLLYGLHISDVFVGQLTHQFPAYTSLYEAIAMKKLVIHNGPALQKDSYPCINRNSTEGVFDAIHQCVNHQIDYNKLGNEAFNWLYKNGFDLPVNSVLNCINTSPKKFNMTKAKLHCIGLSLSMNVIKIVEKITFKMNLLNKKAA